MKKLVIEVIRKADASFEVAIKKDGKRKRYDIDAPEVSEYQSAFEELKRMAISTNAGKISFTVFKKY